MIRRAVAYLYALPAALALLALISTLQTLESSVYHSESYVRCCIGPANLLFVDIAQDLVALSILTFSIVNYCTSTIPRYEMALLIQSPQMMHRNMKLAALACRYRHHWL